MMSLTPEERDILEHSLGIQSFNGVKAEGGYRNYFASGADCDHLDICLKLVEDGLMTGPRASSISPCLFFYVTDKGKEAIR